VPAAPPATRPATTPKGRKRKNAEKEETENEKAKRERSISLISAINRVGEIKEDEDTMFCTYICAQMQKMTPKDRNEAHAQIFQTIMNITMGREEEIRNQ
jgi:hypothetical protein